MITITIHSGIAVPITNIRGRINPYGLDSTFGIKVTKNRINMVGQKASEKLNPSINEPNGFSCLYSNYGKKVGFLF
jgi:hypothetical protein